VAAPDPLAAFTRWLGTWQGDLRRHAARGVQTVPMRLHIERLADGKALRFVLTYGDGTAAEQRDYRLLAGAEADRFQIDERNGIVLDATLHDDVLTSVFEVQGQVNAVSYALRDGHIEFRLAAWRAGEGTATGAGVTSRQVTAMQRAVLRAR
jgi:hypothetical protein